MSLCRDMGPSRGPVRGNPGLLRPFDPRLAVINETTCFQTVGGLLEQRFERRGHESPFVRIVPPFDYLPDATAGGGGHVEHEVIAAVGGGREGDPVGVPE